MQFNVIALALSALVGQAAALPTTLVQRQIIVPTHGTIDVPAASAAIAPGAMFNFDFESVNYCESGYEPITVYLFENEPDDSQMNVDGTFNETLYLYEFGQWLIPNFGMSPSLSMYRAPEYIILIHLMQASPRSRTPRPRRRT